MKIVHLKDLPTIPTSHNGAGFKKNMVPFETLPHLRTFSQATFKPFEKVEEHSHVDFHEIMLVEAGTATMIINGKAYKVAKGTCITVEVNDKHAVINGSKPLTLTYFGLYIN